MVVWRRRFRGQTGFSAHTEPHPDTNNTLNPNVRHYNEDTGQVQAVVSLNNEIYNTSALNTPRRRKKLGEQVNKKLLYRESDLLNVGLVVQKARKLGGTALLQ